MSETGEKPKRKRSCPAQDRLNRLTRTLSEGNERGKVAKQRPVRRLQASSSGITRRGLASSNAPPVPKPGTSDKTTSSQSAPSKRGGSAHAKGTSKAQSASANDRNNFFQIPKTSQQSRRAPASSSSSKANIREKVKDLVETSFGRSANVVKVKPVARKNVYACHDPDIQKVRCLVQQKQSIEVMDVDLCSASNEYLNRRVEPGVTDDCNVNVHLVVDTNVLIDCTNSVKLLKTVKVKSMTPIIIVPWQVLKELDYLKEDKTSRLAKRARTAVNFVMDGLTNGESFVRGQPQEVASKSDGLSFVVEVPDDHLIKCCLQLLSTGRVAVLLTNDKNLIAKASVSGVTAISNAQLADVIDGGKKVKNSHPFESPLENVSQSNGASAYIYRLTKIFSEFLSEILRKCLMSRHGPMWLWQAPAGPPPWGIVTLLKNIASTLPEISSHFDEITRFYSRCTNYSDVTMAEVSRISHRISELIGPLSTKFEIDASKYNYDMAFLKCPNPLGPPPGSNFLQESIQLANLHFAAFDKNLRSFCHRLSTQFGVPFPLGVQDLAEVAQFDSSQFDDHFRAAHGILRGLESLQTVPVDEVSEKTWAIDEIYRELCGYLKDSVYEQFQADDLVQFFKCSDLRTALSNAISTLTTIVSFLSYFKG